MEKLVAEGGTLDQLVALGTTLEHIGPRLGELTLLIPELHASVAALNDVVEPLSQLANRIPGGRRMVMQITAVSRAVFYVIMAFHVDDLLLYPLVFGSMVMSKTYAVSKSALVPLVVRNETELVEANSKLSLISV